MRLILGKKKLLILCFSLGIVLLFWNHGFKSIDIVDENLIELHKCPACYGMSLCLPFRERDIKATGFSRYLLYKYLNSKNIYYAEFKRKPIVIKKLAHNSELAEIDDILCRSAGAVESCHIQDVMRKLISNLASNMSLVDTLWEALSVLNSIKHFENNFLKCLSKRFLSHILNAAFLNQQNNGSEQLAEILYTMLVNPEPLMIQAFPAKQNWPFATYLGACGRTVIETYEGDPLANYQSSDWSLRVKLAHQMLSMAKMLTTNEFDFALYMTDVSLHNFVVSQHGKLTLIDAEGFVVVDKKEVRQANPSGLKEQHYSLEETCHDCLSFSVEDLCSHVESDHNYYAVCRSILAPGSYYTSKGFLHDIPPELTRTTNLTYLLQECATPSVPNGRFIVVPKLLAALETIMNISKTNNVTEDYI